MSEEVELKVWPEAIRGDVKVDLEWLGEGHDSDFDPDDPEDEPLLRMTIYVKDDLRAKLAEHGKLTDPGMENQWADISDGSWCTQVSERLSEAEKTKAAEMILDMVYDAVCEGDYKRQVGDATWLTSAEVQKALKEVS